MKAAVLHEFKTPLAFEEIDRPQLGTGEVLVQVEACGVCHSDLHVADGDWKQFAGITKTPLVLGHEIAGRVVQIGDGVSDVKVGDRVGIPWIHWTCGECDFCREGNENLCAKQKITGLTVDGGFAEFVKAPASHVAKIPDNLTAVQAAPLFCAGVTVYRALKQAQIKPGQRLAVFGVGGLGHIAIQIGREMGAEITAVDLTEDKLEFARSLGAAHTLNAATDPVVKTMRKRGNAHVVLVTSGSKAAYDMAFYCVRATGLLLVVGLPANDLSFPAIMMAGGEVRIQASAVGTRQDVREILAMAAAGKVHCQVASRPLAQANEVLEEMRAGKIAGRVVLEM
ncbi:MAG TPA: zinc-dependent alcohol dehydrogenase [Candidatus Saccharimonadales bacterium]|jgi:propanol-preferring alcohol dehydrogenase|nr:zinc-dependent alcohol dehydrogenase [Candidatus Saccharimonadales bacterium]